jgi:triacylglycerol lipase
LTPNSAIILHHGLFGGRLGGVRVTPASFSGVDRALAGLGCQVFVSSVHPTAGIETRARELQRWIHSFLPKLESKRLALIAHSMGGLDARFMIARLGMAKHVDTLVTISTPHHGSAYADWCVENFGKRMRGFELARRFGWDVGAATDLTRERCERFNEKIGDVAGVRYLSVSCSRPMRQMPAFAIHSWMLVNRAEGANDGLISVKSAKWGEHLETWPVDHWHAANHRLGRAAIKSGDISLRYLSLVQQILSKNPA